MYIYITTNFYSQLPRATLIGNLLQMKEKQQSIERKSWVKRQKNLYTISHLSHKYIQSIYIHILVVHLCE